MSTKYLFSYEKSWKTELVQNIFKKQTLMKTVSMFANNKAPIPKRARVKVTPKNKKPIFQKYNWWLQPDIWLLLETKTHT